MNKYQGSKSCAMMYRGPCGTKKPTGSEDPPLPTSKKLFFEARQCFSQNGADDTQTLRIDLVERVLSSVPVGHREVDQVAASDSSTDEREVVVAADRIVFADECFRG